MYDLDICCVECIMCYVYSGDGYLGVVCMVDVVADLGVVGI